MDAIDAIFSRRSYRGEYRPLPVPKEDLITIMKAGLAAPSGCNMQTTSLIAVDDPQVLARLHSVIKPDVAASAPAAICVLTRRINAYRDKCFAVQDYAAAVENILLAAAALGYSSCWYEGHITDDDRINDKMAEILGVPDEYELVCFLPVGIGESEPPKPQKKPFHERAFFNSFGESTPQSVPPKSITQILLENLGTYFSLPDEYTENRMVPVSAKMRHIIEISRTLHLDTDLASGLMFGEELCRIDGPSMRAGSLQDDPDINEKTAEAKNELAQMLEEADPLGYARIIECMDRLSERRGVTDEERLVYLLSDALIHAQSHVSHEHLLAWLADFKNRVLAESAKQGRLGTPAPETNGN
ncbi:MAG: nitroreductase family protein [Solobacterium sp.]|nr:nitroreductase family protein [Solobacterium sp.]